MIKKIVKWAVIALVAMFVIDLIFNDDKEASEQQTAGREVLAAEKSAKGDLSVSDFKLNKDVSDAVKMLRSKGWRPGDGDQGEMSSEYSGGYFSYMSAYGYVKKDGVFEGYHVPFVQVSYDEYDKLSHFRVVIDTTVDLTEIKQRQEELDEKEKSLYEAVDNEGLYEYESLSTEMKAEFDGINEQRRLIAEEMKKYVQESRIKAGEEIERRCLLRYGYAPFAEENEEGDADSFIIGYKNKDDDICKFEIRNTSYMPLYSDEDSTDYSFGATFTLDYVSARYRAEERLTNALMEDYYYGR